MKIVIGKYWTIYFIFALSLLGLYSCNNTRTYDQWVDIENFQWSQDSACTFNFEITDTSESYNFNIGFRHLNQYPYQNIWVLSNLQGFKNSSFSDTIQYKIADEYGLWYGKRSASLYTFVERMYSGVRFSSPGQYKLTLQHGMREQKLEGVSGVGIKIEKNQ